MIIQMDLLLISLIQDDIKYDTNSKDENLAKFQMTYNPNSILSFDYTYYNIRLDNKYDVWTPDNNGFISYSDYQGLDNQKTKANSLKINLTLDDIKLTQISTYSKMILFIHMMEIGLMIYIGYNRHSILIQMWKVLIGHSQI